MFKRERDRPTPALPEQRTRCWYRRPACLLCRPLTRALTSLCALFLEGHLCLPRCLLFPARLPHFVEHPYHLSHLAFAVPRHRAADGGHV